MHHRPLPAARTPSSSPYPEKLGHVPTPDPPASPSICGLPLKYVSLVTLAVQNAALAIVMHYSRISTPPELSYSPAAAVLLNELIKGAISFCMALYITATAASDHPRYSGLQSPLKKFTSVFSCVCCEIFSPDCWKLSIPAVLYVIQNSLQFVAISNLPVATYQITYQMKILTTAAFTVALLRKKLSTSKWLSLFFLAIGVGIVQIQSATSNTPAKDMPVGSAHDFHIHTMDPLKGFGAVTAACFTSGLAGVYFEMVLKNSKADLWVRNVQLSLFSLIPAILPILYNPPRSTANGFIADLFKHFGGWAWATVGIQVFGGLVTAIVIKYSDNILKGFATSLAIVLSFLASVALFNFHISWGFVIGSTTVLTATWMYNQPPGREPISIVLTTSSSYDKLSESSDMVILGHPDLDSFHTTKRKKSRLSPFPSPKVIVGALGLGSDNDSYTTTPITASNSPTTLSPITGLGETLDTPRYNYSPYGSPWPSRAPTPTLDPGEKGSVGKAINEV
ncbi:hypothetical protein Agabi119p4_2770 [Agaricus bisporus var. burnettii]|uniref:UDP-galactose transporter n=1 Tax=Agaricus bisporus var. burnettii TaxID=192524 RepID=A0A8H7F665_AGABI|nr:hypothetical protein Agabi119p4_2770 [Agaricus bisporus var. burnettii]